LSELLQTQNATPTFYLVALGVALALGALHALTPGHGKTVVAAYLVGSRGTSLHAVGLGAVTTVTHTGSVLLLGLIALLASRLIVPNDLFPILEVASGMLIVLLCANLLYRRWFEYRRASGQNDHHDHLHEHPHSHDRGDDTHGHSHDHGAYHSHGHVPESGQVTWRSLLALGISGGMVPCPDAIAILLLAIAIQRIGLGLALIVSFSLGLAVVLIAIGLAMLHSRRLFARMSAFDRASPVLPMVSAAIVLLLGIALTARAL
jgi:ABC-type nickel/cobalt efflux system permease component RcnA